MDITEPPATPTLIVDLPTVDSNIQRLADHAALHRVRIRPHTKTHKSIAMATRQLAAGASGLTVAKVGEAEVMAAAVSESQGDLLVAFPIVDSHRAKRLAHLAGSIRLSVAIDSTEGADVLNVAAKAAKTTVGILVDMDCGLHRTGLQSPAETLELAQYVDRQRSLRLDGLFTYPGHLFLPPEQQIGALQQLQCCLMDVVGQWRTHGLQTGVVSGGSTPTAFRSHLVPAWTEIRPGTYIYNDMNTVYGGYCSEEDCAARVVATVVSTAVPGKCVIDAGSKTLSADRNIPRPESGFGHVVEYPQAILAGLTEEHGEIDLSDSAQKPRLGERLTIIPNHICPCVNLQQQVWLRRADGTLESLIINAQHQII